MKEARDGTEVPKVDADGAQGGDEGLDENLETETEEVQIQRPMQTMNALAEAKEIQMMELDLPVQQHTIQVQEERGGNEKPPRQNKNVKHSEEVLEDAQKLPQKSLNVDQNGAKDLVEADVVKINKTKVKQEMQTLSTQTITKPRKSNRIARQLYRRDLAEVWHEEHPNPPFSLAL